MARIFFLTTKDISGDIVTFPETVNRHLISLRKDTNEVITCIFQDTSNHKRFKLNVQLLKNKNQYLGKILSRVELSLPHKTKIHIMQCIPKLDKTELIIQKLSELGVYEIIPLFSKNSVVQRSIGENKLTRWNKIAIESSIQSGRLDIIVVQSPCELKSWISENFANFSKPSTLAFILSEFEKNQTFHGFEKQMQTNEISDIYIAIGSEGGFDRKELEMLIHRYQFKPITLGKNILRTETASIVAATIVQYILGEI